MRPTELRFIASTAAVFALLGASSAWAQMQARNNEYGKPPVTPEESAVIAAVDERAPTADELKFFESEIRPLLITHCYSCHSRTAATVKGALRVDTRDAIRKGGRSGPAVVPGDIDSSLLIRAVRYHDVDLQMPPDEKIGDEEIRALEKWVSMGAPDPREEKAVAAAKPGDASPGTAHRWTKEDIAEGRSTHWAYRPVTASEPPAASDPEWTRCLLYTSPSPRDLSTSRMPSSA